MACSAVVVSTNLGEINHKPKIIMKAFISYSHKDRIMLEKLHTHLSQIRREGLLTTWTDQEIFAGSKIDNEISANLQDSQLFIALLSPDYIASRYCYEKEFLTAQEMEKAGNLTIVPVIVEPCDWLNTPFKEYKAFPEDGKPIVEWQNVNTAFLDVITNLRKLLQQTLSVRESSSTDAHFNSAEVLPKNYRIKKDFDSIQKIEFIEHAFKEMKSSLNLYLEELVRVDDNIKFRQTRETDNEVEFILVNRNLIKNESTLKIYISNNSDSMSFPSSNDGGISYSFAKGHYDQSKGFDLSSDEFHMYWTERSVYFGRGGNELSTKDMVNKIWEEWLEIVGIIPGY